LTGRGPNKKKDKSLAEILHRGIVEHEVSRPGMRIFVLALLVLALGWIAPAAAQEELPQIMPSEHKLPVKKDLGPRAIAILQMSSKGKASLLPIAIMIDGKFWDAGAYKANPVPMALESGTVYEAERNGSSQGLFTIGSALHSNAINSQTPWLATGSWVPAGTEKPKTNMSAAVAPVGLNDSEAPPRLTRDAAKVYPQSEKQDQKEDQKQDQKQTQKSSPPSSSSGSSGSSDEPPRLSKPASEPASSPDSTTDSKNSGSSENGPTQSGSAPNPPGSSGTPPTSKPDHAQASRPENVPVDDSGADAAGRPRLRHGKPAVPFADEDIPGYSRPGVTGPAAAVSAKVPPAPEPTDLIPAISDAHGPEPHSYAFEWLKGEEEQRHDQMLAFAKQQLAAYVKTEKKEQITPPTHPSRALERTTVKKVRAPEPVFENAKMVAYDLWLSNQPVLIFTAQAHMPPPASGAQTGPFSNLTYSITIAAYPDIYNNLHKLYVGITDKYHLDVTPRLDLVDAVDADGDGRGELLFRETSDAGTGWVIYRATADSLWKMYDSLNPE
jgi:hypothetical protein